MKVLVFVKATPESEKGLVIDAKTEKMFVEMGKFNEELVKAGIMTEADGLKPSSAGKRIRFSDDGPTTAIDGPFAETKELVAGYWIWNVKSMDEAVSWAKRCPNPMPGSEGELELRPTFAAEEFEGLMTDEIRERDTRLRQEIGRQLKNKAKAKTPAKSKANSKAKSKPKATKAPARKKSKPARAKSKK